MPPLLILCATAVLCVFFMNAERTEQRKRFQHQTEMVTASIRDAMLDYEALLHGGAGLLALTPELTRSQWETYAASLKPTRLDQGVRGIGFAEHVTADGLSAFLQSLPRRGFSSLALRPAGKRAQYCPILLVAPEDERNKQVSGFDLYSSPERREAMDRARDTGQAALTGRVQLAGEGGVDSQPGCVLFVPVFRQGLPTGNAAQRRAALRGFVTCPIRMADLMPGLVMETLDGIGLEILDGGAEQPAAPARTLYASAPHLERADLAVQTSVNLAGHTWTLVFSSRSPQHAGPITPATWSIFVLGLLLAASSLAIIRSLDARRARAEARAGKMTTELRHSEAHNRAVFQHPSLPIAICAQDGQLLEANPALLNLLGYTREEILTLRIDELTHPDDLDPSRALRCAALLNSSDSYQAEKRYRHKSGRPIWVQVNVAVMHPQDGQPPLFIGVVRDISERKLAEAAQAERKALFEAMFENNRLACLLVNPQGGRIVDANDAASDFYGYSRQELQGKPLHEIDILPMSNLDLGVAMEDARGGVSNLVHRRKDGSHRIVQMHSGPFETGGQRLVLSTVQDITDRVRAEAALTESRSRFQALVESTEQGVVLSDADDMLTYVNPAFARLLDQEPTALLGRSFGSLLVAEELALHPERLEKRRQGQREAYETRFLGAQGAPFIARVMSFPLYGQDGQFLGSCGLVADITAQHAAQQAERQRQLRRSALLRLHAMQQAPRQELLDFALEQTLLLTDSPLGFIFSYDDVARLFTLHAWSPQAMEKCAVTRPLSATHLDQAGLWAEPVRKREPLLLNDFAAPHPGKRGLPEGHVELRRLLCVPVISAGRVRAVVGVADKEQPYTEEDLAQLSLFCQGVWDVLERQKAERELREVTERFHLAVRAGRIGLWDWDLTTGLVHCDAVMEGLFGMTDQNRTGTPEDWLCKVHPQDRSAVRQALWAAVEGGRFEASFRVLRPGGGITCIEASAQAHLTAEGKPQRLVGVNIDVTRLREAVHQLEQNNRFLQTIMDTLPHTFFCKDSAGRYLLVNRTFAQMRGDMPIENYLGRGIEEFDPPDLAALHRHWDQATLAAQPGETLSYEFARQVPETGLTEYRMVLKNRVELPDGGIGIVGINLDITERKLSEERLELLARFPEENPHPVLRADSDALLLYANPAAGPLLADWGLAPGGQLPKELRQELRRALDSGAPSTSERSYVSGVFTFTVSPFEDKGYANIYAVDVTQRKAAELAMRQGERLYRELAVMLRLMCDNVPDMIWAKDLQNRYLFANKAMCGQYLGVDDPQSVEGKTDRYFLERMQEQQTDAEGGCLDGWMSLEDGQEPLPFGGSERYEKSGVYRGRLEYFDVRRTSFVNAQGVSIGTVGSARNITQSKAAGEALARSEERFRTMAQVSPVGIFQGDAKGRCTYVNERWSTISGYTREQALGKGWLRTLNPPDRKRALRALRETANTDKDFVAEFRFHAKDESARWVLVRAAAERDARGRFLGIVGALTDITEMKRVEEALRQAKAEAEAATEAKAQFLANMSHEIRTPLAGVIGTSRLLAKSGLNEQQKRLADMAVESGNALLAVVNDILDFSKIEAGQLTLRPAPFLLRGFVNTLVGPWRLLAEERGLRLEADVDQDVPDALVGDAGRLGQVLRNLLGNAIKFTERGGVTLRVALDARTQEQAVLRFSVIDTGLGIDEEYLPRIFDSFSQADSSYGKPHGGTGLGLAICKSLAEQMGGGIEVQSAPGQGSSFRFTARFALEPQEQHPAAGVPAADHDSPRLEPAAGAGAQPGLRVLLAEDNAIGRVLMEHVLQNAGYTVTCAGDGHEVLMALRQGSFDLILMDVQMPRMDGATATRQIRRGAAGGRHAGIAIVALTAYASPEDRQHFMEVGMDAVATKPAELPTLTAAMDLALRMARNRWRSAPAQPATQAPEPARNPDLLPERADQAYLRRCFSGNADLLQQMLHHFQEKSLPDLLASLGGALEQGDLQAGKAAAHRARGALGSIGAGRGAHLAGQAEIAARKGEAALFAQTVAALQEELAAVAEHLSKGLPWGPQENT